MLTSIKREPSEDSEDISEDRYEIRKCRICLKSGEIAIFGENNILSNVIEFAAITISEYDDLPKHICEACHLLLEAAVVFRKTARRTDDLLRSMKPFDDNSEDTFESSNYSRIIKELREVKSRNENYSYSKFTEYQSDASQFELESKDDDTDNLSTASASSSDIKNEREYLFVKTFSEEDCDSDNSTEIGTTKNDTYMIVVKDEENDEKKKKNPFTCSNCYTGFKTIGELENHNELEHNIKLTDKVNCAVCSEVVSKSFYKVHMKLHREKYKEKKKKRHKVECKICNKKVNKSYYKYHMKIHGSENEKADRMRDCPLCQKSVGIYYLNDHMKRIHKIGSNGEKLEIIKETQSPKYLQCPVCDKKIKEQIYKNHLAQHGKPPKKYVCEHCAKEFIHYSAFKTHCLIHKGELKYKCQFCPYRAQYLGLLKVHVRTHTRDYDYKCTECPAKFLTKSNLNQHVQRHKGPGNIKCQECDRTFYRQRNMEEHYKTIHLGIKDVACNICGKAFSHRDRMLSHQLKVHNRDRLIPRVPNYLKMANKNDLNNLDTESKDK